MNTRQLRARPERLPGGHGVVVTCGEDQAWWLDHDQALTYAATVQRAATCAEHDAAVLSLLTNRLAMDQADAMALLRGLRADRAEPPVTAVWPLRFTPCIGSRGPFVELGLDERSIGQVGTAVLREHATAVLSSLAAAELDAALEARLRSTGVAAGRADAIVATVPDYWPRPRRTTAKVSDE